jgi:hypothetical protein
MFKTIRSKQTAKLQRLQDPSTINENNLNKARSEASKHFKNKKRRYLKDKINELATYNKGKNITDLEEEMNLRRVTNLELTW